MPQQNPQPGSGRRGKNWLKKGFIKGAPWTGKHKSTQVTQNRKERRAAKRQYQ